MEETPVLIISLTDALCTADVVKVCQVQEIMELGHNSRNLQKANEKCLRRTCFGNATSTMGRALSERGKRLFEREQKNWIENVSRQSCHGRTPSRCRRAPGVPAAERAVQQAGLHDVLPVLFASDMNTISYKSTPPNDKWFVIMPEVDTHDALGPNCGGCDQRWWSVRWRCTATTCSALSLRRSRLWTCSCTLHASTTPWLCHACDAADPVVEEAALAGVDEQPEFFCASTTTLTTTRGLSTTRTSCSRSASTRRTTHMGRAATRSSSPTIHWTGRKVSAGTLATGHGRLGLRCARLASGRRCGRGSTRDAESDWRLVRESTVFSSRCSCREWTSHVFHSQRGVPSTPSFFWVKTTRNDTRLSPTDPRETNQKL